MNRTRGIVKNVITGNWISSEINAKSLYFIFFVTFLIILLIYNRYRAEELIMQKRELQDKVEILHSKYTKMQMNTMIMGTERTVAQDSIVISLGLKLPENPPSEIVIK
jgi:cell division protein FtsL